MFIWQWISLVRRFIVLSWADVLSLRQEGGLLQQKTVWRIYHKKYGFVFQGPINNMLHSRKSPFLHARHIWSIVKLYADIQIVNINHLKGTFV